METKDKRRRSFVDMRRKSLLFDKIFHENNEIQSSKETSSLTLDEYLASLKEELSQWKDLLRSRFKQLKDFKMICNYETEEIIASEIESYLSEEDRIFLENKPNYLEMMEHANKYVEAVHFLKRYKVDVIEYYDEIVKEVRNETNSLIDFLCQDDICELCHQTKCTETYHKFPFN